MLQRLKEICKKAFPGREEEKPHPLSPEMQAFATLSNAEGQSYSHTQGDLILFRNNGGHTVTPVSRAGLHDWVHRVHNAINFFERHSAAGHTEIAVPESIYFNPLSARFTESIETPAKNRFILGETSRRDEDGTPVKRYTVQKEVLEIAMILQCLGHAKDQLYYGLEESRKAQARRTSPSPTPAA